MNNKIREYAQFYVKFWFLNAAGMQTMANNAPPQLQLFMSNHTKLDSQLIFDAFQGLATGTLPPDRPVPDLLRWFAANTQAATRCDEILQQKQRVTSVSALLNKAYSLERSRITDLVHKFLVNITTI